MNKTITNEKKNVVTLSDISRTDKIKLPAVFSVEDENNLLVDPNTSLSIGKYDIDSVDHKVLVNGFLTIKTEKHGLINIQTYN